MFSDGDFTNLQEALHRGLVKVEFTKADGTVRTMVCTKNQKLFPADFKSQEKRSQKPAHIVVVYDVEKDAFRSFRRDSILSYSTDI